MKLIRKLVPKPLEEAMAKLGPVKCGIAGAFFYAAEKALVGITANELRQGDYIETISYGAAAAVSIYATATFLLVGDGWIPVRNYFQKRKRARRLYNSWKKQPSYKTLENSVESA